MFGINVDFKPTQGLEQAEREAANKLAAAQGEDDLRKAAVAAGSRRPPGKGERPYLASARGRDAIHSANAAELQIKLADTISRYNRACNTADEIEDYDTDVVDPLQTLFFNQWTAVPNPDQSGRLLFYPTGSRSDYGNPSYDGLP